MGGLFGDNGAAEAATQQAQIAAQQRMNELAWMNQQENARFTQQQAMVAQAKAQEKAERLAEEQKLAQEEAIARADEEKQRQVEEEQARLAEQTKALAPNESGLARAKYLLAGGASTGPGLAALSNKDRVDSTRSQIMPSAGGFNQMQLGGKRFTA
jgi:hypothetical protein